MRMAPSFIFARRAAFIMPRVSSVSGVCMLMTSAWATSSSRLTSRAMGCSLRKGSKAITSMPKAWARLATSVAMLPAPMRPSVFLNSSVRFNSLLRNLPSFMDTWASIRRAGMATMKAMAISATATLLALGVFIALMPFSAHSFLSTLSMPTPPRMTSLRFGALARRSASTLVFDRTRRTWASPRVVMSLLAVPKMARRSGSLASKASAMRMCMESPEGVGKEQVNF